MVKTVAEDMIKDRIQDMLKELSDTPSFRSIVGNPSAIDKINIEIDRRPLHIAITFSNLEVLFNNSSVSNMTRLRKLLYDWAKEEFGDVKIAASQFGMMILSIKDDTLLDEASIQVFKRNPKTNKITKAYKCIGGRKDGRKVSNPSSCTKPPDPYKRIKFNQVKRASAGSTKFKKASMKLNNLAYKRSIAANKRLTKARKFGKK